MNLQRKFFVISILSFAVAALVFIFIRLTSTEGLLLAGAFLRFAVLLFFGLIMLASAFSKEPPRMLERILWSWWM